MRSEAGRSVSVCSSSEESVVSLTLMRAAHVAELPQVYYFLFTTSYLLLPIYYLLFTTSYLLLTIYYLRRCVLRMCLSWLR